MNTARPVATGNSILGRLGLGVMRVALALLGFLMVAAALLLGVLMAFGLVIWSLLRGRRPAPVNLRWQTVRRPGAFRRDVTGDVVDVQAREVVDPPQR